MKSKPVALSIAAVVAIALLALLTASLYQYNKVSTVANSPKVAREFATNTAKYIGNEALGSAAAANRTVPNATDVKIAIEQSTNAKLISYSNHELKLPHSTRTCASS